MRSFIVVAIVVVGLAAASDSMLGRLRRADCLSCFKGKLSGDSFSDIFSKKGIAACASMDAGCVKANCAGQKAAALADACGQAAALGKCLAAAPQDFCTADFDGCADASRVADCYGEGSGCDNAAIAALRKAGATFEAGC